MSAIRQVTNVDQSKALVLRWFDDVWNNSRRETIHELLDPSAVIHDGSLEIRGPDAFVRFYNALRGSFSDFNILPEVILMEGDLVSLRWTCNCVHILSQKPVMVTGCSIVRVEEGRFVEAWQNWDAAGLAAQLPGFSLPRFF